MKAQTLTFFPVNSFSDKELDEIMELISKHLPEQYLVFKIGNVKYRVKIEIVENAIENHWNYMEMMWNDRLPHPPRPRHYTSIR